MHMNAGGAEHFSGHQARWASADDGNRWLSLHSKPS
jgi:hypothetical protein